MTNPPPQSATSTAEPQLPPQTEAQQTLAKMNQPSEDTIEYPAKDGSRLQFSTNYSVCKEFGFPAGSRVYTPKGYATGESGQSIKTKKKQKRLSRIHKRIKNKPSQKTRRNPYLQKLQICILSTKNYIEKYFSQYFIKYRYHFFFRIEKKDAMI